MRYGGSWIYMGGYVADKRMKEALGKRGLYARVGGENTSPNLGRPGSD
jgi:hypothetical protein